MVEVNIPAGVQVVKATSTLYQWDYGQKLRITGDNLPLTVQVHFCNRLSKEAIVSIASTVDEGLEAPIPDELLKQEHEIHAFIYLVSTDGAKTIKQIQIPVNKRAKPADYPSEPTETELTELETLLANLNSTHEDIKESQQAIEDLYNQTITYAELRALINEQMGDKQGQIDQNASDITTLKEKTDVWETVANDVAVAEGGSEHSGQLTPGYYCFKVMIIDGSTPFFVYFEGTVTLGKVSIMQSTKIDGVWHMLEIHPAVYRGSTKDKFFLYTKATIDGTDYTDISGTIRTIYKLKNSNAAEGIA